MADQQSFTSVPLARRANRLAIITAVMELPVVLMSCLLVGAIGGLAGGVGALIAVLAWLATGALVLLEPAENLASRLRGERAPSGGEGPRIEEAWHEVASAAGLDPSVVRLRVARGRGARADAYGRHVIAVTSGAVQGLHRRQLAALLARTAGQHMGGQAWVVPLLTWLGLPGRLLASGARLFASGVLILLRWLATASVVVLGAAVIFGQRTGSDAKTVGRLIRPFLRPLWWTFFLFGAFLYLPFLLPLVLVPLIRAADRRRALWADETAAALGYGPALAELISAWRNEDEASDNPSRKRLGSLVDRMLASKPSPAKRLERLDRFNGFEGRIT